MDSCWEGEDEYGGVFGICPSDKDEPAVLARVSGNSVSPFVELSGWSYSNVQGLLRREFVKEYEFLELLTPDCALASAAEQVFENRCSLRDLLPSGGQSSLPLYVHVMSKRKVDVSVSVETGKVTLISQLVIGDHSGYCVLCAVNEGMATVYDRLEVGDVLLLKNYSVRESWTNYHRDLFDSGKCLTIEIKLQYHSVKRQFLGKFQFDPTNPLPSSRFRLPTELLTDETITALKLPFELETELGLAPSERQSTYYDVIGVIAHVGRVIRVRTRDSVNVACKGDTDSDVERQRRTRFLVFRDVHLYDARVVKPVRVRISVNNRTAGLQASLVPGVLVILTHCSTHDICYSESYVKTSSYSQVSLDDDIVKYYLMRPQRFQKKVRQLIARETYVDALSRRDIAHTAGGPDHLRITDERTFAANYRRLLERDELHFQLEDGVPMVRRESRRLLFSAILLRCMLVQRAGSETLCSYQHLDFEHYHNQKSEYRCLENFWRHDEYENSAWFSFTRSLPPPTPQMLQKSKTRDIVMELSAAYTDLCRPLLMPSGVSSPSRLPPLAECPMVDGPPYVLLDLVNETRKTWYTCIWRGDSEKLTRPEKTAVRTSGGGGCLLCIADVHCTETDSPVEVSLLDFVVDVVDML